MLSIAILTYKDDVIFTSLLILYFLAVYHAMAYHLRNLLYLWNILGNIYFHQSLWETQIKTAQTNRMIFLGPDSCRIHSTEPTGKTRWTRLDPVTLP